MIRFDWIGFVSRILTILLVIALLSAIAVRRDGTLLGKDPKALVYGDSEVREANTLNASIMSTLGLANKTYVTIDESTWRSDDIMIISSSPYASKTYGFGGNTPLYIAIKDNKIVGIANGINNESPTYWQDVLEGNILEQWVGKSTTEACDFVPDVISGATMSSNAVNHTVLSTINGISGKIFENPTAINIKSMAALLVLAFGLAATYLLKGKKWRMVQIVLNIVVLGFWCGSFISLPLLINWISNGNNIITAIIPFTMIVLAIIMPFFGKREYYCTHICPFGASQELISKINIFKIHLRPQLVKTLTQIRELLTFLLIGVMIIGIGFDIINYEAFSVFLFGSASWIVIGIASAFLILSLFTNRPYCRFLCPTGQILKWSEKRLI